ncbi:hypothetical protein MY4824_008132 [Beauveria thailandica]
MPIQAAHDSDVGSANQAINLINHDLIKSVFFKTDVHVLPLVALLFLCLFLDRTKVGNAKIIGLENDIHIIPSQYRNGLAIYYAWYIARFPAISSSKKVSLQIWLPFLAFAWGIITIGIGSMREYKDFMILQAVLGIFEGGPFPGIVLYFSRMCPRGELAVRISVLYTGGSLSGAFGGLLACGLSAIGPRGRLEGWRWIFIVEGVITAIIAVTSYICLPNSLQEAPFLSTQEQQWAIDGLEQDEKDRFRRALECEEPFQWSGQCLMTVGLGGLFAAS